MEEDAHKAADKCAEIEESVLGRVSLVDDLCDDCVVETFKEAPYDCDDKCAKDSCYDACLVEFGSQKDAQRLIALELT